MAELLFVLVLVRPISEGAIMTYAGEFESRIECYNAGIAAKREYPDIVQATCTRYVLKEVPDEPSGSGEQQDSLSDWNNDLSR